MSVLGAQTSAGAGDEVVVGMRSFTYQQEMRAKRVARTPVLSGTSQELPV